MCPCGCGCKYGANCDLLRIVIQSTAVMDQGPSATCSSTCTSPLKRAKNALRSQIRRESGIMKNVLKSCQSCSVKDNLNILDDEIGKLENGSSYEYSRSCHLWHLKGLKAVLKMLLVDIPNEYGSSIRRSFIEFEEAFDLFLGYSPNQVQKDRHMKKRFKELVCHPKFGLSVYIVLENFIVLKSEDADLEYFIKSLIESLIEKKPVRLEITHDLVSKLLKSIDTEWDRKVLRVVIAANRTKEEIDNLGIDSDNIPRITAEVQEVAKERENALELAKEEVEKRLQVKLQQLKDCVISNEKKIEFCQHIWTNEQINDLSLTNQSLKERVVQTENLLKRNSVKAVKNVTAMVSRMQKELIKANRIGVRKASSGRPRQMDDVDEQFLLHCIENKATAHGRRHDAVMYLHHRVKKRDFLNIVNHSRISRDLPLIKSATTVYNRGKPKNERSLQASKHLGLGLFCAKKPPEAENKDNELTHYQRAHKRNILISLCAQQQHQHHNFNLIISQDDKAYICPGTSTGMKSARNVRVFQSSNEAMARKLPKYDFPQTMLNITPGVHRIMTKEICDMNGKKEIRIADDQTIVFARPKYFVGSTASVWASEFMRMRWQEYNFFVADILGERKLYTSIMIRVRDKVVHFLDATEENDVRKIGSTDGNEFWQYEKDRLLAFKAYLEASIQLCEFSSETQPAEQERLNLIRLLDQIRAILILVDEALLHLSKQCSSDVIWTCIEQILDKSRILLCSLKVNMPIMKTRFIEFTDGGPGVGVSNRDVHYRIAERFRICDADFLIRHHLSNDDSSQNEVERCQSYVGDALCDGGALDWEYKKPLDGISENELAMMESEDIEMLEYERMKFNAFKVCEEIAYRVDGAPAPGGFLKGYVSENAGELFFSDQKYLLAYLNAAGKKKMSMPGATYYSKLEAFIRDHEDCGQKYAEVIKQACSRRFKRLCAHCQSNPWVGPACSRIPRPMPDYSLLPNYKYLDVNSTPTVINNKERDIDDLQPRKQLQLAFSLGKISLEQEENIASFCDKFIVEKDYVVKSLEQMHWNRLKRKKRAEQRKISLKEEESKAYHHFDWIQLLDTGHLNKLRVKTLDLYLQKNNLRTAMQLKKREKLLVIQNHIRLAALKTKGFLQAPGWATMYPKNDIQIGNSANENTNCDSDASTSDGECASDDDNILDIIGELSEANDEKNDIDDEEMDVDTDENAEDLFTKTRSGRVVKNHRATYHGQGKKK